VEQAETICHVFRFVGVHPNGSSRLCACGLKFDEHRPEAQQAEIVRAPWSDEQVRRLHTRQGHPWFHAYTCPEHSGTLLEPGAAGWRCPDEGCVFVQDWAFASDAGRS
jgi:hypothetical protein